MSMTGGRIRTPEWRPGDLTSSQLVKLSADALADLASRVADDLSTSTKQAGGSPAFTKRVENILYVATGIPYNVTPRGE